MLQFF